LKEKADVVLSNPGFQKGGRLSDPLPENSIKDDWIEPERQKCVLQLLVAIATV
jgi:hypothetical protein